MMRHKHTKHFLLFLLGQCMILSNLHVKLDLRNHCSDPNSRKLQFLQNFRSSMLLFLSPREWDKWLWGSSSLFHFKYFYLLAFFTLDLLFWHECLIGVILIVLSSSGSFELSWVHRLHAYSNLLIALSFQLYLNFLKVSLSEIEAMKWQN